MTMERNGKVVYDNNKFLHFAQFAFHVTIIFADALKATVSLSGLFVATIFDLTLDFILYSTGQ